MFRLIKSPLLGSTLRVAQIPTLSQTSLYHTKSRLQSTVQTADRVEYQKPSTDDTYNNGTSQVQRLQLQSKNTKEAFAASAKQACYDGLFDVWLLASHYNNRSSLKNTPDDSVRGYVGDSTVGLSKNYRRDSLDGGE
ncbi:hypothetical protein NXS19_001038 [Fusarium pseudograminearum]|uniref:Uncharacterized protein n=1 Tax=Fusarium pseudograminearum (strain CS3096) TaxID=1028729 RepID=K3V5D2_FUSPC|nr:hypothetical protein FPSE_11621 [Fusarium pseudograminearum CS3096]EKJ68154.1 hypothetical protein FPSE_11621 [Fusarium pseudograminearum CS3096]UZP33222.1 hypothetical protein NXS19_001038 [Fusarium pseudograminearum]